MSRWGRLRSAALVPALAVVAAACSTGAPAHHDPPLATLAPTTSTTQAPGTTAPDPYAVPAVITKAYVQRVLDALEVVNGQATDLIVANRAVVPGAVQRLQAIDTAPEFVAQQNIWFQGLAGGLANLFPRPGSVVDTVDSLLSVRTSCVFLAARRDYTKVDKVPPPAHLSYFALTRNPAAAASPLNPTPWVISFLGVTDNGSPPPDQCAPAS